MPQAYVPSDPTQQKFLAALALGEVGRSGGYSTGVGGADLSHATADSFGFPQWAGVGDSHAAGEFQFQPGTFDQVAAQHGLDFRNPADQNAAAWYLAQDTFAQKTGGDLTDALNRGDFTTIQSALAGVWPSVTGNASAPGGLAQSLASGLGVEGLAGGATTSADTSGGPAGGGGVAGWLASEFARFGVLIVGGLIVVVALWWLLSERGVMPSPGDTVKAVGKGVAAAAVV